MVFNGILYVHQDEAAVSNISSIRPWSFALHPTAGRMYTIPRMMI